MTIHILWIVQEHGVQNFFHFLRDAIFLVVCNSLFFELILLLRFFVIRTDRHCCKLPACFWVGVKTEMWTVHAQKSRRLENKPLQSQVRMNSST